MSRYSAKSVGRKAARVAVTVAAATALAASASAPAFADETDPVVDEIRTTRSP
ncbi:hypothetical protein [Streptomyces caelestis]|uniref:hypothetical protein n=1 Tax=Streptomyces caelestis TaxID=36816 RepID=UPI0036629BD4